MSSTFRKLHSECMWKTPTWITKAFFWLWSLNVSDLMPRCGSRPRGSHLQRATSPKCSWTSNRLFVLSCHGTPPNHMSQSQQDPEVPRPIVQDPEAPTLMAKSSPEAPAVMTKSPEAHAVTAKSPEAPAQTEYRREVYVPPHQFRQIPRGSQPQKARSPESEVPALTGKVARFFETCYQKLKRFFTSPNLLAKGVKVQIARRHSFHLTINFESHCSRSSPSQRVVQHPSLLKMYRTYLVASKYSWFSTDDVLPLSVPQFDDPNEPIEIIYRTSVGGRTLLFAVSVWGVDDWYGYRRNAATSQLLVWKNNVTVLKTILLLNCMSCNVISATFLTFALDVSCTDASIDLKWLGLMLWHLV